jgi:primosomal protein DnaI
MEALSEFLKQMSDSPLLKDIEKKHQYIQEHPLIKALFAKHPELRNADLKANMNRLHQYLLEYGNCKSCPGLDKCPNDFTGHYTKLTAETVGGQVQIYDHKVACRKQIAQQGREAVRKRIRSFYIDERALSEGYSLEDIATLDRKRLKAVKQVKTYIDDTREKGLQKKGLFLYGSFGTGKTFLMCWLLNELAKEGFTGVIVYMPDFIEDLKSMFQDPKQMKDTIDMMKNTDLLVFDDIGAENLNPWVRDHVLGTILNYRMERKPTLFTSNYELDTLEKHFSFTNKDGEEEFKGRRIMNRIRPFVEQIFVQGDDQRGKGL